MNYFKTTLSGLTWTAGQRGGVRGFNILKTVLLARLLTPAQFGFFGISAISLGLLDIATETGINVFLLQENDSWTDYVDTAWVISILRGLFIFLLIMITAPAVSGFFSSPQSLYLLYLISLVPFIRGFINPSCIRFQKQLQFRQEFYYRSILILVETLITVILGLYLRSAQALVWGLTGSAALEVALSFFIFSPRPRLQFQPDQARFILSRWKWVTGFGLLNYIFTNLDNIVVGRLLGSASLGIYQNSYRISTVPLTEINDVFYKVTFPVFTQMKARNRSLYPAAVRSILAVSVPVVFVGLGIAFFAGPLVRLLLGPGWEAAIGPIRILSYLGIVRGISLSVNSLFMALKKQVFVTFTSFISVFGLGITLVPLVHRFGLLGAAYSALIGSLLAFPVSFFLAARTLKYAR